MLEGLLGGKSAALVWPSIRVGMVGLPLNPLAMPNLVRAVVDTHLHLPDMFELIFADDEGNIVSTAGLDIGTTVKIAAGRADDSGTSTLISGEVTAIEAICQDGLIFSVVRGYERAHRLQRAKRTRTWLGKRDSQIATDIARAAGLRVGDVQTTRTVHQHLAQVAQTDWDFLTQRAREIGFETGVEGGEFFFRRASGRPAGGALGGVAGAVADAAKSILGLSTKLVFKDNLLTFLPRVTSANLTPDVEVRVWDTKRARVAVAGNRVMTGTAELDDEPGDLARDATRGMVPIPALPPPVLNPGLAFVRPPSTTAHLVVDRPAGRGPSADAAAKEIAEGVADHVGSVFAEAEGDALGDPAIQAGAEVEIGGVPEKFVGTWVITNARHVFDAEENGYHTRFWVSGRQNRNLLGLTNPPQRPQEFTGLVCGVVTNVQDPEQKGRVKVTLPWLAHNYESDWARTVHIGAGKRSGPLFLPEVGDEVLVGFEFGDARRPYVLGGLLNDTCSFGHLGTAVAAGTINKRGIVTPSGTRLLFTDRVLAPAPPTESKIELGTADGKTGLSVDQVGGTVTLSCAPSPPASRNPVGSLTIECGGAGTVTIRAGAGGMKLESEGTLELSGKLGVRITSPGVTEVKGSMLKLN
ncbi:phage baseplate assembly protein V [Actinokineospora auranticolor]|uniref:Gp5/Type VI secretion system Vgr protein OB-fold domain-containing protein n=1 Tax=Actinokineospora auranticolor TaxID=155976 RepID=A0A2S6GQX6_9PSEU|nr:phage baseplate assembly protein V [Actinokineospora auranticolor]PPK67655.1 hypothetical protein CLV40_107321 [Actinokineospora auranticolor]